MPKTYLMIRSNPLPGMEARYNEWYDQIHLPEMLQIKGVKAYQRFALAKTQMNDDEQTHKYLIRLEIDSDDIPGTIARMWEAYPSMRMEPVVDHDTLKLSLVQELGDEVRK